MSTKKNKPSLPVRKIRESLGMTQEQLATKLGTTSITVSRWERGESQPLPVFARQIEGLMEVFPAEIS